LATDFVVRRCTKKWFAQQVEFSWMLFHENSTKKHFIFTVGALSIIEVS